MEAAMTNFQPSNGGRRRESIAGQIQPLGQSPPLSSGVSSHSQVSGTEFSTGINLENRVTGNLQQHGFYCGSGPLRSVLDPGEDSPWNGKPYPGIEFSSISDYSNQGAAGTFRDIGSSVNYSSCLSQSIASPHATALPPSSGNFIALGRPSIATPHGGGGFSPRPTHEQKHSLTRASLKDGLAATGLLPRNNLKGRSSPTRKLAGVNGIRKLRKEGSGVSQLIKAFPLIGELKAVLKAYPSCAVAISLLEESIGQTMVRESRASRPTLSTCMHPLDIESDIYSAVASSTCGTSSPNTTDFSCPSQNDSSMTFPSTDGIPNEDFMDMTMDNETPRARASNTTIYHCTVPVQGKFCKFSANSEGDWVRHEESDKHWPQKRYMCINCIDIIEDEEGNPLCVFCLQRLPPVGNYKMHYLQCQEAQRGKHVFNAARKDHFRNHLRKHGMVNITPETSAWTFDVESDWHRQCGFCTQTFTTWDERKHHVAKHFQQGMEISSWKLPPPKTKQSNDYRPGIDHRRDEDDDDDDDDDDSQNSRPKSHQTPTVWFSGQPSSRQANNPYPAEEWLEWIEGGTYNAQAGPTSTEKVEAYLKHQSQVESEADDGPLSDTKGRNSRGSGDFVALLELLQKDSQPLFDIARDFADCHIDWDAVCFYETQNATYGPLTIQTVSQQSATQLGKRMIPLDTDHMSDFASPPLRENNHQFSAAFASSSSGEVPCLGEANTYQSTSHGGNQTSTSSVWPPQALNAFSDVDMHIFNEPSKSMSWQPTSQDSFVGMSSTMNDFTPAKTPSMKLKTVAKMSQNPSSRNRKNRMRLSTRRSLSPAHNKHAQAAGSQISHSSSSKTSSQVDLTVAPKVDPQEAIALFEASIQLFSTFSQLKAADLINQLKQLVLEEQKYGKGSQSGSSDVITTTTAPSTQGSISNPEMIDSECLTDNTSVSSAPRQPLKDSEDTDDSMSTDESQTEVKHESCENCGVNALLHCTWKNCGYSTHSFADYKRHESGEKHWPQERWMCLECVDHSRPSDLERITAWGENLVQLDEELQIVQFTHRSVLQHLLEQPSDSSLQSFHIKLEEADHFIGEICVTYLNSNDFKTDLIRNPAALPTRLPNYIIERTVEVEGATSRIMRMTQRLHPQSRQKSTNNKESMIVIKNSLEDSMATLQL